jgi:hypothetical protein
MTVDGEGDKPTFSADDLSQISAPVEGAEDVPEGDKGGSKPADGDKSTGEEPAGDGKPAEGEAKDGAGDKPAEGKDAADKAAADKAAAEKAAAEVASWPEKGFPDNWRERIVASLNLTGDDLKKAQETAKRASGPGDLLRSVMHAAGKIQEATDEVKGRPKIPTGKDDKPEDVAAFDKAWGVPEAPDKYTLPDRPKDLGERTEEDIAVLKPALEQFHKGHFSQTQVNELVRAMDEAELTLSRARAAAAQEFDKSSENELRDEWGTRKDYDANLETANRVLQLALGKYMPEQEERTGFLSLTLDNGRKLGSYPGFVKFLVDIGRNGFAGVMDDGAFVEGAQSGAKDPEERMREITRLAHTGKPADEAEYKRLQPELMRLAKRVQERKERKGA